MTLATRGQSREPEPPPGWGELLVRALVDALRVWPTQAYARLLLLVALLAVAACDSGQANLPVGGHFISLLADS